MQPVGRIGIALGIVQLRVVVRHVRTVAGGPSAECPPNLSVMATPPVSSQDRLLIALRMKYPPDLSRAERDRLAERLQRSGTSLVFGYWVLLVGGLVDLVAAAVTKNPGYFLIGVVFVLAGYGLFRHYRAMREVVGPTKR